MSTTFSENLLAWFDDYGRKHLPWQENRSPYRVWVSEIMLQQTQVSTVIPYYQAFMADFPSVEVLAAAEEDQVMHRWTGLGYYARARNLHKTAKQVVAHYGGEFPADVDSLGALPGIGRSTAGAILSLGHGIRAPILDGNVKRVLSRYHLVDGVPDAPATQKMLWDLAEHHTPRERFDSYTQAIMDLGATLCSRSKPACGLCPANDGCLAFARHLTSEYPQKKPKKTLPVKSTYMLIFHDSRTHRVLLEKRPPQGIWGGLWSFPESESVDHLGDLLLQQVMEAGQGTRQCPPLRHTFSHYHLDITPVVISLAQTSPFVMEDGHWHWYDLASPSALGLAAPVKKLLGMISEL